MCYKKQMTETELPKKLDELEIEAQQRLIKSGVVEELKALSVFIWAMNGVYNNEGKARLDMSVDITENKDVPFEKIEELVGVILAPMDVEVHLQRISIRDFCCYGQCKGCLNGNPEAQAIWIGKSFR